MPRARLARRLAGNGNRNQKEPIYRASSKEQEAGQPDGLARAERRSRVTNGKQLFLDGDARLRVSRRFRDVLASIATDLGGVDRLSEGQKQIARRCAMLSVECEIMESAAVAGEPFDLDAYGQLTDRLGRAFSSGLASSGSCTTLTAPDLGRPI